jgi:hypothetical protein
MQLCCHPKDDSIGVQPGLNERSSSTAYFTGGQGDRETTDVLIKDGHDVVEVKHKDPRMSDEDILN